MRFSIINNVAALAVFVMASGCEASGSTTGTDGLFNADFVSVTPSVAVGAPQPLPAGTLLTDSISGYGYVNQIAIDPPPGPVPTATPIASSGSGSSTGGIVVNPPVQPPISLTPSLILSFSSGIFSDDCMAKAAQAAALHLHLTVEGEGQVSRWAAGGSGSGSGSGSTGSGSGTSMGPVPAPAPQPPIQVQSGAFVQASKIFSCELGPSICPMTEMCVQPLYACKEGTNCTPPPCQCQPTPAPKPTATPLASSLQ
jgi:hypothetical protein